MATSIMKPLGVLTIYIPLVILIIEALLRWLKLLPGVAP